MDSLHGPAAAGPAMTMEDSSITCCSRQKCVENANMVQKIKLTLEDWKNSVGVEPGQSKFFDELSAIVNFNTDRLSSVSKNDEQGGPSSQKLVKNQEIIPSSKRKSAKMDTKCDNDYAEKSKRQKLEKIHYFPQKLAANKIRPSSKWSLVGKNKLGSSSSNKLKRRKNLLKKLVLYKTKMREKKNTQKILTEKVMSNHVMARIIFQHLSLKDLLQCSLVSKTWLAHSRLTLRKDKRATARLVSFSSSCHNLKAFNVMMDKCGSNIPFNGLSIFDYCRRSCRHVAQNKKSDENDLSSASHHPSTSFLFNPNVCIKYLRLVSYQVNEDCPIFQIVQKVLTTFSHNLLQISIGSVTFEGPKNPLQLIGSSSSEGETDADIEKTSTMDTGAGDACASDSKIVKNQNQKLVNLSTLEILGVGYYPRPLGGHSDEGQTEVLNQTIQVISDFMKSAPNLSKISGDITPDLTPTILTAGKAMLVKKFNFTPTKPEHLTNTTEFALEGELRQLTVSTFSVLWSAPMNTIMLTSHSLYNNCCVDTLKSLRLGHADLLMFIDPTLPLLPSLVELKVTFYKKLHDLLPARSLSRIDWAHKFPMLDTVFVERADISSRRRRDRFVQEFHQRWANVQVQVAGYRVKKINFNLYTYLPLVDDQEGLTLLDSFATPFPNVSHLCLNSTPQLPKLLSHLWTHWIHLESLTLTGVRDTDVYGNLDGIFLGISKDNWQQCREELMTMMMMAGNDDEKIFQFLMDLRTEPSIINLRKLKLLRIHLQHSTVKCGQDDELEEDYQEDGGGGDGGGEEQERNGVRSTGASRAVFITEVTGRIAFAQMSGLVVEICRKTCSGADDTKCLFSMDSISPFVKIIEMLPTEPAESWGLKMMPD